MNKLGYLCYEQYKESGVEWLEKIPGKWDTRRLKRCVTLANRKCDDSALPYVGLENVESFIGRYLPATGETQPDVADSFAETDVLFGKLRPYLAKVLALDFGGRCTGEFLALRPRDFLDRRYLFHCCLSHGFVNIVNSSTFGSKMPRADWQFIGRVCMPLPSIAEQRAIAAFLDRETARIDALIEKQERLLEKLEEKRKAMIAQAVTRGLDSNVPLKESGVEWLGKIPAGWDIRRGKAIFSEIDVRSRTGEEILLSLRMTQGLVPHSDVSEKPMTQQDLIGYKLTFPGDIVVNRMRASSGLVAVTPQVGLVSPDYAVFRRHVDLETDFFALLFRTPLMQAVFRSESTGLGNGTMGFLRLYSESFLSLPYPFPEPSEQRAIVSFLREELDRMNDVIVKIQCLIAKLREKRTALISAAVTGKIRVSEDRDCAGRCDG